MRKLIIAGALATIVAAPAFAQTYEHPAANPSSPHVVGRGDQHGVREPDAVMKGRQMIGRDPDPWIRNEILRHSDSGWPD